MPISGPGGAGGGGGGGGGGSLSGSITFAREQIGTDLAVASGDAFSEVTLTKAPVEGDILTFELEGSPPGYAIAIWNDVNAKTGSSTNPGKASANVIPIKVQTPGNDGFSHDSFFIAPSDESTKLWLGSGRDTAETVNVFRHYISNTLALTGDTADIPADAGYWVDVSGERGGTPPNASLDKNDAYYNRDTGRVWIPHRRPAPDTPASLTADVIAGGTAGYRGVRYSNPPAPSVNGDFYYNRGSAHSWRVAADRCWLPDITYNVGLERGSNHGHERGR